jgi:hypothetical protein
VKQVLAIFCKDARRFWPEIAVCIGLLLALVVVYPATWSAVDEHATIAGTRFAGNGGPMGLLANCLVVLVPIAWLVLIARVVHCEQLVGDTQYWLTRPYDWRKLFAAKLAFLAAFLYAPFFVAQCVLLAEGGFHPFHYLGGLLFNLLLLTAAGVLPVLALSALTTGFGRLMLVLLGLALVVVIAAVAANSVPSYVLFSVPVLVSGQLAFCAIFCGSLAAALTMYARRRAKAGWLIVGALALVLCATAFSDPDGELLDRFYPAMGAGAAEPVTFTYGAAGLSQSVAADSADKHAVDVDVPMFASGVQDGYVAIPQALKATLTSANGARWESPWQGYVPTRFLPGKSGATFSFRMRRSVYDQFKAGPVTLRISVAVAMARESSEWTMAMPAGDFAVAGFGVCRPEHWILRPDEFMGILCRSAMNQPQLTYVSALWSSGGCKGGAGANAKQMTTSGWMGVLDPEPAGLGITSVWAVSGSLPMPGPPMRRPELDEEYSLCAGTPVQFTQYRPAGRLREDVTIQDFRLPELAIGDRMAIHETQ